MQSWGQGKLEPSADPELVMAQSWDHNLHLHFLYLSFPEPPPSTDSNMVIMAVLFFFFFFYLLYVSTL